MGFHLIANVIFVAIDLKKANHKSSTTDLYLSK